MVVKFLQDNTVEVRSTLWRDGEKPEAESFALGELSLSVIDFDYGNILNAMSAFADSLGNYEYEKSENVTVSDYLNSLKPLAGEYEKLIASVNATPLARFTDDYEFLNTLAEIEDFFGKADKTLTVREALEAYPDDDFCVNDKSGLACEFKNFKRQWHSTVKAIADVKALYEFVYLDRPDVSLSDKIQEYGLDKFNAQIFSAHKIHSEFKVELQNGGAVFAETLSVDFPRTVGETVLPAFLRREFVKLLQTDLKVKRCKNCGRMFIVSRGYDNLYCSSVPADETQACNIVGPHRQYLQKTHADPYIQIYKRVYKRLYARRKNDKNMAIAFLDWSENTAKFKDSQEVRTMPLEKFEQLLLKEAQKFGLE